VFIYPASAAKHNKRMWNVVPAINIGKVTFVWPLSYCG